MITDIIKDEVLAHAKEAYPNECCGIVVFTSERQLRTVRLDNLAESPRDSFIIDPKVLYDSEKQGSKVVYIYHSHPDGTSTFSPEDIISCEETDVPFLVVSYPEVAYKTYSPKGHNVELLGRPFLYGVYDCWTLVRDALKTKLGVQAGPVPYKEAGWWKDATNAQYYYNCLTATGELVDVTGQSLQENDIILMTLLADVPNHLAYYVGDGYIMHHPAERKSALAVWGGFWEHNLRYVLRHKSLL